MPISALVSLTLAPQAHHARVLAAAALATRARLYVQLRGDWAALSLAAAGRAQRFGVICALRAVT